MGEKLKAHIVVYREGMFTKHSSYSLEILPESEEDTKLLEELYGNQVVFVNPTKTTSRDKLMHVNWTGKR